MAQTKKDRHPNRYGSGDVPGLNPVIKSVVYGASHIGNRTVTGIRRGWEEPPRTSRSLGFEPRFLRS